MKFYRVHYYHLTDGSAGFEWFTSSDAARRAAGTWRRGDEERLCEPEVEAVNIIPTKAGILSALNSYAGHEHNG